MNKHKRVFITCLSFVSMASIVCHAHDENIASLIQQLEHTDEDVQNNAYRSLSIIGEAAVPGLIVGLNHENAKVRMWVVQILHGIRTNPAPHNKDIVRAMAKALKDDDPKVRDRTVNILFHDWEPPPEFISGLVQLLYYGSSFYHPGVSEILLHKNWHPQGQAALIEALHSSEWPLRFGTRLRL